MTKQEDPLDESMTVVKTGTGETLTRKSKLTYQIGTLPDGEVYFRIHKNTGNGFFSNEWIALADIRKDLSEIPAGKPVTAIMLNDLFIGKSVNTPGFLLAVLVHEKLLIPMQGKKRSHEAVDLDEITEWVDRLGTPKAKPKAASRKTSPAAKTKAQLKKKSAASRKKVLCGRTVPIWLYTAIRDRVLKRLPELVPCRPYTLKMICGEQYWSGLRGFKTFAGLVIAELVDLEHVPYQFASDRDAKPLWYWIEP